MVKEAVMDFDTYLMMFSSMPLKHTGRSVKMQRYPCSIKSDDIAVRRLIQEPLG